MNLVEQELAKEGLSAQKELNTIISKLPTELADSMPKYSEREMRELRNQLQTAINYASFTKRVQDGLYVFLDFNPMDNKFIMTYHLYDKEDKVEDIKIDSVEFDDHRIVLSLDPKSIEQKEVLRKAIRR